MEGAFPNLPTGTYIQTLPFLLLSAPSKGQPSYCLHNSFSLNHMILAILSLLGSSHQHRKHAVISSIKTKIKPNLILLPLQLLLISLHPLIAKLLKSCLFLSHFSPVPYQTHSNQTFTPTAQFKLLSLRSLITSPFLYPMVNSQCSSYPTYVSASVTTDLKTRSLCGLLGTVGSSSLTMHSSLVSFAGCSSALYPLKVSVPVLRLPLLLC